MVQSWSATLFGGATAKYTSTGKIGLVFSLRVLFSFCVSVVH